MIAEAMTSSPLSGPMVIRLLAILVSAALTDNILLTRFLGMCPFLSLSKQVKSAFGMGLAVIFVLTCTVWINWVLYTYVLLPLEPYGLPAESLKLILFIVVIAAFVQLMEMLIERISMTLYYSLGIFLPLITVNCNLGVPRPAAAGRVPVETRVASNPCHPELAGCGEFSDRA